jgi:hypothetical protein
MFATKMRRASVVLAAALTLGLLSTGSAVAAPSAVPMAVNCTEVNNDFVAARANSIKVQLAQAASKNDANAALVTANTAVKELVGLLGSKAPASLKAWSTQFTAFAKQMKSKSTAQIKTQWRTFANSPTTVQALAETYGVVKTVCGSTLSGNSGLYNDDVDDIDDADND